MTTLKQKLKALSRAYRLKKQIAELLPQQILDERDVGEDVMNKAVELYDRICKLETEVPEVKTHREDAEIYLERMWTAMEWWFSNKNPHDNEPTGDWS